MRKLVAAFLALCFCLASYSQVLAARYNASQYDLSPKGDHIEKIKPNAFDYEAANKTLLAEEGFTNNGVTPNSGIVETANTGKPYTYENGALKVTKENTDSNIQINYQYSGDIKGDNYYLFSCKIKTEYTSGEMPASILAAYTDKHIGESGKTGNYTKDITDWYTMYQLVYVPVDCDFFMLRAYLPQDTVATAYYDDFKLYCMEKDSLKTVLLAPAYKGYLFGEKYGDISLDVCVDDNDGKYPLSQLSLKVQLTNEAEQVLRESTPASVTEKMNFVFSSVGLPRGKYYLRTTLYKGANELAGEVHTLRKVGENDKPKSYIDDNGHLIQNGQKVFIKGVINSNGDYLEAAQKLMETPIRKLSHYGRGWWSSTESELNNPSNSDIKNGLAYMRVNNIKLHIALPSYYISNIDDMEYTTMLNSEKQLRPFLEAIANDYKEDAILDSYYLFDEIEPQFYGDEIAWNREILSEADPDHPVTGIADKAFSQYGAYSNMVDVLGIDPYPVSGTADNSDLSVVGKHIRSIKENFPNRPVFYVLQCFNWSDYGKTSDRSPNYAELKNMAYQALCEGADGIECYGYLAMKMDQTKTFDEWWTEIDALYTELESYEQVFLSDEAAPAYTVSNGGDWLNISVKRYNGKTYLFAVNNQRTPKSATVNIEGLQAQALSFAPLEVKTIELLQDDYLFSEAELKSMGFFNCNRVFGVSDGDVKTVYINDDSQIINYAADISDNASLIINGSVKPARGKLLIDEGTVFTVSVKAESGKQSKQQQYRVIYKKN